MTKELEELAHKGQVKNRISVAYLRGHKGHTSNYIHTGNEEEQKYNYSVLPVITEKEEREERILGSIGGRKRDKLL